eukprot:4401549-Amphidinium_carterae.2
MKVDCDGPLQPWSPEGWLGYLAGLRILPCRYSVHTLATPATYSATVPVDGVPRCHEMNLAP